MALASVHPSVRHTLQPYQNSDQKIFTVGHDKNFCSLLPNFVLLFEGIPLERGRQKKVPPKRRQFGVLSSSNVKTVADKYKQLVAYRNKHWSRAHLIMYSIRLHHSLWLLRHCFFHHFCAFVHLLLLACLFIAFCFLALC